MMNVFAHVCRRLHVCCLFLCFLMTPFPPKFWSGQHFAKNMTRKKKASWRGRVFGFLPLAPQTQVHHWEQALNTLVVVPYFVFSQIKQTLKQINQAVEVKATGTRKGSIIVETVVSFPSDAKVDENTVLKPVTDTLNEEDTLGNTDIKLNPERTTAKGNWCHSEYKFKVFSQL